MNKHRQRLGIPLGITLMLLAACGGRSSVIMDSAPKNPQIDPMSLADPVPVPEPRSRYGNPGSYVVAGKRYYVLDSSLGYREQGIASWYGAKFHGRRTSSGEPFDMFKLSAAHPSLPLPTYVRVRNLDNGRQMIVRVNDRGPFHAGRIIDLSWAAGVKLGVVGPGSARVEVEAIDARQYRPEASATLPPLAPSEIAAEDALESTGPLAPTGEAAWEPPPAPLAVIIPKPPVTTVLPTPMPATVPEQPVDSILPAPIEGWVNMPAEPVAEPLPSGPISEVPAEQAAETPVEIPANQPKSDLLGLPASVLPPATGSPALEDPQMAPDAVTVEPLEAATQPFEPELAAEADPPAAAVAPMSGALLQLGIFRDRNNAMRMVMRATEAGIPSVRFESDDARDLFRVVCGPFLTDADAQDAQTALRQIGVDSFILQRR